MNKDLIRASLMFAFGAFIAVTASPLAAAPFTIAGGLFWAAKRAEATAQSA